MTRVVRIDAGDPDLDVVRAAAALLRAGGLVAFPTETVYGLGAHALDTAAVRRLFEAKGRPVSDPLIVHLDRAERLDAVVRDVPGLARTLAARFWPGALTLVLHKQTAVPDSVTAGLQTVAVRVPSHPVAHRLMSEAGVPIAAPSANRFSRPSPTRAEHVLADLEGVVDLVIDAGPTPIGVESTILDLTVTPPAVRRPGGVSLEELRRLVPDVRNVRTAGDAARPQTAPGQLLRHYAPRAPLTVYLGEADAIGTQMADAVRTAVAAGSRVGVLAPEEDLAALAARLAGVADSGRVDTMRCGSRRERNEIARDLYASLRRLDAAGPDLILAAAPADDDDINAAIVDRLTRAAEGRVIRV